MIWIKSAVCSDRNTSGPPFCLPALSPFCYFVCRFVWSGNASPVPAGLEPYRYWFTRHDSLIDLATANQK